MNYTLDLEKVGEDAFEEFIKQQYICIFFPNTTSSSEVALIIINAIRKFDTKKYKLILHNLTFDTSSTIIGLPTQYVLNNVKPENSLIPDGFVVDLGHTQIRLHAISNNKIVESVFLTFGGEDVSKSLIFTDKLRYETRYFQSNFLFLKK